MMKVPLLCIGMPVYNGAQFLEKALDSYLAQTFRDFEIIISDNASTDRTQEICQQYAARDSRIRYVRNDRNMGAGWNLRRVYSLANSKYYKQAAHDDFCAPQFLQLCIDALESDPSVVVAHSKTVVVDETGKLLEYYEWPLRTESPDPVTRFRDLLLNDHKCYQIFGVMRMSALRSLPPQGSYVNSDGVLLAQLGLIGRYYEIPEFLFISTQHIRQSMQTLPLRVQQPKFRLTRRYGTLPSPEWWDPSKTRALSFPELRQLREYAASIANAPITPAQKLACYRLIAPWVGRHFRRIVKDLIIAADQVLYNLQTSAEVKSPPAPGPIKLTTHGGESA